MVDSMRCSDGMLKELTSVESVNQELWECSAAPAAENENVSGTYPSPVGQNRFVQIGAQFAVKNVTGAKPALAAPNIGRPSPIYETRVPWFYMFQPDIYALVRGGRIYRLLLLITNVS